MQIADFLLALLLVATKSKDNDLACSWLNASAMSHRANKIANTYNIASTYNRLAKKRAAVIMIQIFNTCMHAIDWLREKTPTLRRANRPISSLSFSLSANEDFSDVYKYTAGLVGLIILALITDLFQTGHLPLLPDSTISLPVQRTPRVLLLTLLSPPLPPYLSIAVSHGGVGTPPTPAHGRRRRRPASLRDPSRHARANAGAHAGAPCPALAATARPGDLRVRRRAAALLAPLLLPRPRRPRQAPPPRQPRRRVWWRGLLARGWAHLAQLLRGRGHRLPRSRAARCRRPRQLAAPTRLAQHEGATFFFLVELL
jgi:hypothetical protein